LGYRTFKLDSLLQELATARPQTIAEAAKLCQRLQYLPPQEPGQNLLERLVGEQRRLLPFVRRLAEWSSKPGRATTFTNAELVYIAERARAFRTLKQQSSEGGNAVRVYRSSQLEDWSNIPWYAIQILYERAVNAGPRGAVFEDKVAPRLKVCSVCGALIPPGRRTVLCGKPECVREATRQRVAAHRRDSRKR
jgi:hypothetical protein